MAPPPPDLPQLLAAQIRSRHFCYLHKPLLSFPRYIITRPTKPTVHYLPSFSLRPSPSEPPADQRFSREYAPEADHLDAILIDSSRAPTDEAPTPADTVMDEFVSESDSDYTSYWRDWVSLLSLILFDGPHAPAVVAMSTLLYGASCSLGIKTRLHRLADGCYAQ